MTNSTTHVSQTVLPSIIVLMVLDALAISTSTSNISPSELCSLIIGMVTYNLWVCVREGERGNTSVMPINNTERNTKGRGRGEGKGREGKEA